jgi:hypothetical protein
MAGRHPPGSHEPDRRWLVDRQIYERRADEVHLVTWTRRRQVAALWAVMALLGIAAAVGGGVVWAWQRHDLELSEIARVVLPAEKQRATDPRPAAGPAAAPVDGGAPAREVERLRAQARDAEAARQESERELAAARARIEALELELAAARAAGPAEAGPAARATDAVDLEVEVTLLRHERDAAREQIDALMQLSSHLKEELARAEAGRAPAVDGADEPLTSDAGTAELHRSRGRELVLSTALERLREEFDGRIETLEGERDQALAALAAAQTELEARGARTHALEASVTALEGDLAAVRAELDEAKGERDATLARRAAAEAGIAAAAGSAESALEQHFAAATSRIAEPERAADERRIMVGVIAASHGMAMATADAGELDEALATALARLKELDQRLGETERRNGELEAYLARLAPPPPPAAPR